MTRGAILRARRDLTGVVSVSNSREDHRVFAAFSTQRRHPDCRMRRVGLCEANICTSPTPAPSNIVAGTITVSDRAGDGPPIFAAGPIPGINIYAAFGLGPLATHRLGVEASGDAANPLGVPAFRSSIHMPSVGVTLERPRFTEAQANHDEAVVIRRDADYGVRWRDYPATGTGDVEVLMLAFDPATPRTGAFVADVTLGCTLDGRRGRGFVPRRALQLLPAGSTGVVQISLENRRSTASLRGIETRGVAALESLNGVSVNGSFDAAFH